MKNIFHEQCHPRATLVGGFLLSSFINVCYNQSASRIVILAFLSVNNEIAVFVQKTHPNRAFLRNKTRTDFICSTTTDPSTSLDWICDIRTVNISDWFNVYRTVTTSLNWFSNFGTVNIAAIILQLWNSQHIFTGFTRQSFIYFIHSISLNC